MHRIIEANWRDALPDLPDGEAALAIVDGPYNLRKAEWDKFDSWDDFRAWYAPLWAELSRVLRDNCSLYVWGTFESLAALKPDLDAMGGGWRFLNHIAWVNEPVVGKFKDAGTRSWLPAHREGCLFYARERVDISALAWDGVTREDNTIRAYLNAERERAGLSRADIDRAWRAEVGGKGGMSSHWFGRSQWALPTRENYLWLRDLFNKRNGGDYLRREYEDLRREYEDLRREYENLRYPFHSQKGATDVWEVPICAGRERVKIGGATAHVAQKPLALYERIISASSDPGDLVLDPMAGTGTAAVAAKRLGRRSVCVEIDERYCEIARARIAHAAQTVANREPLAAECAERTGDTCAELSAQPALMEV